MRANSLLSTGENLTEILGWALAGFAARLVSAPPRPSGSTP